MSHDLDDFLEEVKGLGLPPDDHRTRVWGRVQAALAAPTGAPDASAPDPSGTAAGTGGTAPDASGTAAGTGGTAAGTGGTTAGAGGTTAATTLGTGALVKSLLVGTFVASVGGAAWWLSLDAEPSSVAPPSKPAAASTQAPAPLSEPSRRPPPPAIVSQPAHPAEDGETTHERPPVSPESAPAAASKPASPAASRPARLAAVAGGNRELELLKQAQLALRRGEPARALTLLQQNDPADRALVQERSAVRIWALCALGRVNEAQRAYRRFESLFPNSVHADALESSCANPSRN